MLTASGPGNRTAGDEIIKPGFLLLVQLPELETETLDPEGGERSFGMIVGDAHQTDRNVLQVKIFIFQENIKSHVLGRDIIKDHRLELQSAFAYIADDKGGVVDKGEGAFTDLKPLILAPFFNFGKGFH